LEKIRQHPKYDDNLNRLSHLVLNGKMNGYLAAEELLTILLEN
jgi:hypothetical protein